MKLPYEFRRRCEKIAADQRRLLERAPHDPLCGEELAQHHGIWLCEPHDLPGATNEQATDLAKRTDWDGVFLPAPPNHAPIILLRPGASSARRQSTLMHEMAHYLLNHVPLSWNDAQACFEPRRPKEEREAQHLGGCLQIPHVGLVWAVQTGLTVARAASHFGASKQMVVYRARVTGISLRQ